MPTLKRRTEPKRQGKNFRDFYQSNRWHAFSKAYLKKNRLCAECKKKGIIELAQVTDHIVPLVIWIQHGGDPYDISNLQPLSKRCHNRKTALENKGWNKQ